MATESIPAKDTAANQDIASAYWDGALVAEDIALTAERISETAFALAGSQLFEDRAQHAFFALAELCSGLQKKAKADEERLTSSSQRYRNPDLSVANA